MAGRLGRLESTIAATTRLSLLPPGVRLLAKARTEVATLFGAIPHRVRKDTDLPQISHTAGRI
jgi:hypothetical protein